MDVWHVAIHSSLETVGPCMCAASTVAVTDFLAFSESHFLQGGRLLHSCQLLAWVRKGILVRLIAQGWAVPGAVLGTTAWQYRMARQQ